MFLEITGCNFGILYSLRTERESEQIKNSEMPVVAIQFKDNNCCFCYKDLCNRR